MNEDQKKQVQPPASSGAQVEEVIKDPTERFNSPGEVLADQSLTQVQKEAILKSWVKDAELLSAAESENMGGGESSRLRESSLALATLAYPADSGKKGS